MTDTTQTGTPVGLAATRRERAEGVPALWRGGDYHRFATSTIWPVGRRLVEAAGVAPGQRVLDVAAGSGNVALRAAEAGADVVAVDLTPESLDAGRHAARELGVDVTWVEGDAEALPVGDDEFDVVTSCFGVMFAADQEAVARELVRVCRPGGTVALASFVPEGVPADFFGLLAPYLPPPPAGAVSPLLWGDEAHVRALFGDRVSSLEAVREEYEERAADPDAYVALFRETFGPVVAAFDALADDPARARALEEDLHAFARRCDRGAPGGPSVYPYAYLRVLARTADG
jgi:SAM-dependent methyltransferase